MFECVFADSGDSQGRFKRCHRIGGSYVPGRGLWGHKDSTPFSVQSLSFMLMVKDVNPQPPALATMLTASPPPGTPIRLNTLFLPCLIIVFYHSSGKVMNKCCRERRENEAPLTAGGVCRLAQPLWKSVWRAHRNKPTTRISCAIPEHLSKGLDILLQRYFLSHTYRCSVLQ